MAFLREVIASAEESELDELKTRLPILRNDLHLLKSDVVKSLEEIYKLFLVKPQKNLIDPDKIFQLQNEQILKKERYLKYNLGSLAECMSEACNVLEEIKIICQVHENIFSMKYHFKEGNFSKSLQILKEVKKIMKVAKAKQVDIYFFNAVALFESSMFRHFDILIDKKYDISSVKGVSCIKVKQEENIDKLIISLFQYNRNIEQINYLTEFLWEYVLMPIINGKSKVILNSNEMKVINMKTPSKINVTDICKKLFRVNSFFQNEMQLCLDETENFTLLCYMAKQWEDKLSLHFINNSLRKIDITDKDLKLEKIIEDVKQLQTEWNMMKFVRDDSIVNYALNLNKIYLKNKCSDFVKQMKTLVHTSKEVMSTSSLAILMNIKEMIEFIHSLLINMKNSSEPSDSTVFLSICDCLAYYRQFIKNGHSNMTYKEIGLTYNNCVYIAEEITLFNFAYCDIANKKVPFRKEAVAFSSIGEEIFESFLDKQKRKIIIWLEEGYNCSSNILQEFPEFSHSSMRNCLELLENLKEAWGNILSLEIYNKAIGILFNIIYEFFIKFIMKFEKINPVATKNSSHVFEMFVNHVNLYIPELTQVEKFVNCYLKFKAISFILNSDLAKIESDWCCTNSCLKLNLEPTEVRILIKALFQDDEYHSFHKNYLI